MDKDSRNKTPMIFLLIAVVLFLIFAGRIAYIIFFENDSGKSYSDPEVASTVVRGDILDRNGNVLASQVSQWTLYFRLNSIDDLTYAAMTVSPFINMSIDEIVAQAGKYTTYARIKDRIDMNTASQLVNAVEDAGLSNAIDIIENEARSYASLFHACQLIGFVNRDGEGAEGLEYRFDEILSPWPGLNEETTYGDNLMLTLDFDIQYLVDVAVQNIAYEHDPDYIMAIVSDAKSGEILAMSSYPWYDLNSYNLSSEEERLNRCAVYDYEPGSVFKIFTLAKCIEAGIDTDKPFVCDGSETFTVNGSTFTINCHTPHGLVDGRQMIAQSCNGAIASWVLQLSDEDFYEYLSELGFGSRPDTAIPATSSGFLSSPSSWSARSKATISFGQEINVNALQIVQAASAISDGGIEHPVKIVKRITSHDGSTVWENDENASRRVMSEEAADAVLDYMITAVENGTASKAAVKNVTVAAKTGTAQLINPESGSYEDGTNLASTLALVPAENPQYIVYFAISAPRGNSIWGADIAAPACASVIEGLVRQGKIIPSGQKTIQVN